MTVHPRLNALANRDLLRAVQLLELREKIDTILTPGLAALTKESLEAEAAWLIEQASLALRDAEEKKEEKN